MCEAEANESPDADHSADWLAMAAHWRGLAGDKNSHATLARLMHGNRAPA
ncbi:MAG: hypothetical protein JWL96_2865 [Sphingomonas bacterium]|nr:hypothetical protein [Sphingomonas bacterium]